MPEEAWSQTAFLREFAVNVQDLETVLLYIRQAIERAGLDGNANTTTNRTKINNLIDDAWNANKLLFHGSAASADRVKKGLRPYVRYYRAESNKKAKGKTGTSSGAKRPFEQTSDPEVRITTKHTAVERLGPYCDPPEISEASVLRQQLQPLKDQHQAALDLAQQKSVKATEEHLVTRSALEKLQAEPSIQKMASQDDQRTTAKTETAEGESMENWQDSFSRQKKYTKNEKETEEETQDVEGAESATLSLPSKPTIPPTLSDDIRTTKATEATATIASVLTSRSISPVRFGTYRPPNVLLTRPLPIPLDLHEQAPPSPSARQFLLLSSISSTHSSKQLTRGAAQLHPPDAHPIPRPQVVQPTALAPGWQFGILDKDANEARAKSLRCTASSTVK